jgi:hypothetical protein
LGRHLFITGAGLPCKVKSFMRRWRLYALVLVIVSLLWGYLSPPLAWGQNSNVTLSVMPSSLEVTAGQTIDMAVAVQEVTNLYGFDIVLGYDPAVVEVVDLDPDLDGIQLALGLFLDPGFVIFNQADNSLGQLRLVMTQLSPSEAKSGDGNLIVIRFRALQAGETPLLLIAAELAERSGATFAPQVIDGQLSVTTTPVSQPIAPTPIPSQIAGTPLPTMTPAPAGSTATQTPIPPATATQQAATPTPVVPLATTAATAVVPAATEAAPVAPPGADNSELPANEPAGNPAEPTTASQQSVTEATNAAESTEAANSPAVVADSNTAATNDQEAADVTVIGSDLPAEGSAAEVPDNTETGAGEGSWIAGASLGGGLLLAIILLFFFLGRNRAAGAK